MPYWDARAGKYVDKKPAWWALRRQMLGRDEVKTRRIYIPQLPAPPPPVAAPAPPEPPCEAVVCVGDRTIEPTEKPERTSYASPVWNPPWEVPTKLDMARWPNTWMTLVKMYYSGTWYQDTKFTSEYKPSPPYQYEPHKTYVYRDGKWVPKEPDPKEQLVNEDYGDYAG